jgi:hypothetical protein
MGASASIAVAQIAPIPGMVIKRDATSSSRARLRKSFSSAAIFSERDAMCSKSSPHSPLAISGKFACVSINTFNLETYLTP